ncbi:MAG TPA: DMT family transporter [Selenomonadales bacterium]|nr:DMT family transporter [Selenomonadales bacterium]
MLLIVIAAFCHAAWNYLAKKACGGTPFIWLMSALSALIYSPLLAWVLLASPFSLKPVHLALMLGSAILHLLYFILLDKGYRVGDLSVIYPLARGTGPLLSTVTAIVWLGETPSPLALAGTLLIGAGIVAISGNPFSRKGSGSRRSILYALLCGTAIAGYTIVDKIAVSVCLLPPLLMDWCTNFGRMLLLSPYAMRNRGKVAEEWRCHRREVLGVSVLSPLAYILVLTAMVFSPVSYVAPAREISILIGALLGAKLLSEENARARLAGAATMLAGLISLALG